MTSFIVQVSRTADLLSRLPVHCKLISLESEIDWIQEQELDEDMKLVKTLLARSEPRKRWYAHNLGRYFGIHDRLSVREGVLCFDDKTLVPFKWRMCICELYHDSCFAGHRGVDKTYELIRRKFFWFDIFVFVKWYCDTCELCQKFKSSGATREPLQGIIVNRPWQIVGIDFTGPFNRTRSGMIYIVIAIDYFTKFID